MALVIPPDGVRALIERTAAYVRRAGPKFVKELRERNSADKKFDFLKPSNPFHVFYELCVKGEAPPKDAKPGVVVAATAATASTAAETQPPSATTAAAAHKPARPAKPAQPPTLTLGEKLKQVVLRSRKLPDVPSSETLPTPTFSVDEPGYRHAADLDIVRITAQFAARNGRDFLAGLAEREATNPQFRFLAPQNDLFGYFRALVTAYSAIINEPTDVLDDLRQTVKQPETKLLKVLDRAKIQMVQEEAEARKMQSEEDERAASATIDWQNFTVVETIGFDDDDVTLLPRPSTTMEEIAEMIAEQEYLQQQRTDAAAEAAAQAAAADDDMDVDMDMDMSEGGEEEEEAAAGATVPTGILQPSDETAAAARSAAAAAAAAAPTDTTLEVLGAKAKAVLAGESGGALGKQKCPVCGELIPVAEISEHIRIELLDPKWKVQKQELADRQRETSLAATDNIGANLARLARARTDLFDGKAEAERAAKADVEYRQKLDSVWQRHKAEAAQEEEARKAAAAAAAAAAAEAAGDGDGGDDDDYEDDREGQVADANAAVAAAQAAVQQQQQLQQQQQQQQQQRLQQQPMMHPDRMRMSGLVGSKRPAPPPPAAAASAAAGASGGAAGADNRRPQQELQPQQPAKRQRLEGPPALDGCETEAAWLEEHSGPVSLTVSVPEDANFAQFNFKGQALQLSLPSCKSRVQDLKKLVSKELGGMPIKKMKLTLLGDNGRLLAKDGMSLAYYNTPATGAVCALAAKVRGGRRK